MDDIFKKALSDLEKETRNIENDNARLAQKVAHYIFDDKTLFKLANLAKIDITLHNAILRSVFTSSFLAGNDGNFDIFYSQLDMMKLEAQRLENDLNKLMKVK